MILQIDFPQCSDLPAAEGTPLLIQTVEDNQDTLDLAEDRP